MLVKRDISLDTQVPDSVLALRQGKTKEQRESGRDGLEDLAARGSALALFELGQWYYEGKQEENKEQGLRLHVRAARMGYLRSVLALQAHEDPLGLKYDFLRDGTPLEVSGDVASSMLGSCYTRFATYWTGLELGAKVYAKPMAELILTFGAAAGRFADAHRLAFNAYDLLDDFLSGLHATHAAGSREAIEGNNAIASGFRSWSDWKARTIIGQVCAASPGLAASREKLAAFTSTGPAVALPGRPGLPELPKGLRVMEIVADLNPLIAGLKSYGIDLAEGILALVLLTTARLDYANARSLAQTAVRSYFALGEKEGVLSYYNLLLRGHSAARYLSSDWREVANKIDWGVGAGFTKRELDSFRFTDSTVEHVLEQRTWQGFSPPGGNVRNTHTETTRTRKGSWVLMARDGEAHISMRFGSCQEKVSKNIEINRTTRQEGHDKPVFDFEREWSIPVSTLRSYRVDTNPSDKMIGPPAFSEVPLTSPATIALLGTMPTPRWDDHIDRVGYRLAGLAPPILGASANSLAELLARMARPSWGKPPNKGSS
jgi:hypothetical protein